MGWMVDGVGRLLAHYLEKPVQGYEPFTPSDPDALRATLQPGDVLLVEGNNHISGVIKYLTQSTWSHAALYVGPIGDRATSDGEPLVLVEANLGQGVMAAPLSKSDIGREQGGAPGDSRDPPLLALCAARFRYLPLFRGGQTNHRARLQLQVSGLGRSATPSRRSDPAMVPAHDDRLSPVA
jgi:hypothetical protein